MIPLAWALPSMDEVNEQARERGSSRVSLTRRVLAAVVDLTVLAALFVLAWIVLSPTDAQIAKALAVDPSRAGAKTLAFRFIGGFVRRPDECALARARYWRGALRGDPDGFQRTHDRKGAGGNSHRES